MKFIYLPGNGKVNEGELHAFVRMLEDHNQTVYGHQYLHWADESLSFDEQNELDVLHEEFNDDEYVILGKSIGTYVAVKVAELLKEKVRFIILMGIPTGIGEDKTLQYSKVLSEIDCPIYVIQNDKDPYGALDEMRKVMDGVDYNEIIMEADNHIYMYAEEVENILLNAGILENV
ncbi:alpha/beta hydrolase [Candidatus Dojkabacteria bacterium]|uniref:Alpha/beta hydrolase n=1 Tax=Candidatus Dojkabacteria bacterium TaxID=2099670 RepID=A0A955L207_9BACT|nr:alpha/beta hydrolase [Candidatus Dojkabacteria bacterium]